MAISEAKLLKAQLLWATIQENKSPIDWEGFQKKHFGLNPLVPPYDEAKLDAFILEFGDFYLGKKSPEQISRAIDYKKLRDFVEEQEKGSRKIEEIGRQAETRGKAYVQAEIKRRQEIIRRGLETPVVPSQKGLFLKILGSESDKQPEAPVEKLVSKSIELGERAQPFAHPEVARAVDGPLSFTQIKNLKPIQKAIMAPLADVLVTVFPNLRQGTMNKDFEDAFRNLVNFPDRLTKLFGSEVVASSLFQQMLDGAKKALPTGSSPGGAKTIVDDIASSLFHHAPEPALVAYWELYQIKIAQGLAPPTLAQFQASGMGIGGALVRVGANEAKGFVIRKGLTAVGGEALAGLLGGPPVWIAGLLAIGSGLLGKIGGWFKNVPGLKTVFSKEDWWILALISGPIILIIFLTSLNQFNVDSSLATNLVMGGGQQEENQYLDVSITATPASSVGNRPTAIRYDACVKPKGAPSSFKINGASVTFSAYGATGNPNLNAPTINPDMFSGGCYSFTIPVGSGLDNSVITATFDVNADAGNQLGVDGSDTVSTVIGNPSIECFAFGPAGAHDGYGHVSSAWDSTAAVTAAIGVLARSSAYMSKVCTGGATVTVYRVNANFGGGSTSPPNSIFMYNACATTACATYTLAHETGHIIDSRTGLFGEYNSLALYAREGPLWTYPNGFSEHEDFAETLGAYVVWHNYTWGARHGHPGGNLNYSGQYPLHYNFAKEVFGGVEY